MTPTTPPTSASTASTSAPAVTPATKPPVLVTENLDLGYDATTILENVNLTVAPGAALALIGANGSGKSTLLKGILGMCRVTGVLRCVNNIGYVPQHQDIDPSFPVTAQGVVAMGLSATTPWWRRVDSNKISSALARVNLEQKATERFGSLSGGQRQRVLIARSIVTNPALMLLDEPFNGLDTTSRDVLVRVLTELKQQGTGVVVSTHDYSLAEQLCEQTAVFADGHVTIYDTAEALLHHILTLPYLQRPLVLLLILGIVGGTVGVLVNLRAMEFSVEALVHSVFPGMVVGLALGGIDGIVPGAAVVAAVAAAALTFVTRRAAAEAGTAVVLTSFYGVGVVLSLAIGDYSGQLDALMFGRLLDVTDTRLIQTAVLSTAALVILLVTWRKQVAVAFDRNFMVAQHTNVTLIDAALNAAIAAVVVVASSAVGVLLVIGYLIIPGAAARLLARTIPMMVGIAVAAGLTAAVIGVVAMNVDVGHQISPQAAVSLSLVVVFTIAIALNTLRTTARSAFRKAGAGAGAAKKPASQSLQSEQSPQQARTKE